MTAPVVHAHDVVQTPDGTLHTVDHPVSGGVDVTDWTGGPHHTLPDGTYRVLWHHHTRSPR